PERAALFPYTTLFRSRDGPELGTIGSGRAAGREGHSEHCHPRGGPHESGVATAHHLFSPPRRNLRTSRCFSSDNGSLMYCCRIRDRKSTRLNSSHVKI